MQAIQRGNSTRKVQQGASAATAEGEDDELGELIAVKLTYEETVAGDDWEARVWLTELD